MLIMYKVMHSSFCAKKGIRNKVRSYPLANELQNEEKRGPFEACYWLERRALFLIPFLVRRPYAR
jgi:hypothetical protein